MTNLLGGAAAPGFDDPLEMLEACHGRIQSQCATLTKLLTYLPKHGCDLQAQQAAQAILRYFDTAGQHHHQDEECDLFPCLCATSSAEARELVACLLEEHKGMEATWQRLRPMLLAIADGQSAELDATVAQRFIDVYDRHIAQENGELLPLAERLLSSEQLKTLGQSMAARRGVTITSVHAKPALVAFADVVGTPAYDHPKPERLVKGNPLRTTWEHYCNATGEVSSGVWACEPGAWRIVFDECSDEYFHVLEGRIRISDAEGNAREFGPGDACVIPAGFTGTFEVLEPVKKHYVMVKRKA
jgi:uncharacterized cupin superfamily protein/hemerythrin-like domain-containing protein